MSKLKEYFNKIGKGSIVGNIIGAGGELLTGDVAGALKKLFDKGEISEDEYKESLEIAKLEFDDLKDARKNETLRDTSEHTDWLGKNIHEMVILTLVLAWLSFKWFKPELNVQDVKEAVMLTLAYLFGKKNK